MTKAAQIIWGNIKTSRVRMIVKHCGDTSYGIESKKCESSLS